MYDIGDSDLGVFLTKKIIDGDSELDVRARIGKAASIFQRLLQKK